MYGLDTVSVAERADVWRVLGPDLPGIADKALDAYVRILPYLAAQIEIDRHRRRDLIVQGTKALFLKPYDEAWLARVRERVETEAANRGDTRTRLATNMWIIRGLNAVIASRWFISSRRRFRLMDIATRILMHDASLATSLHYALRVRQSEETNAELTEALGVFDHVTKDIRATVVARAGSLRSTSRDLLSAYNSTAEQAHRAVAAASSTARHVTSAAGATESFSTVVEDLSRISASCASGAQDACAHMNAVNQTIATLSGAVERIGSVVDVIADVATHTKLLALNATIEAARAGAAGRGFAVVATEVKSLAAETSTATSRITDLINSVQAVTAGAVAEMGRADANVGTIAIGSRRLAEAVDAQTHTAEDLARAASATVADAAIANEAVMHVTQSLDLTKDAAAAMSTLSEDLEMQMQTLHRAIETFFDVVERRGSFRPLPKIMSRTG